MSEANGYCQMSDVIQKRKQVRLKDVEVDGDLYQIRNLSQRELNELNKENEEGESGISGNVRLISRCCVNPRLTEDQTKELEECDGGYVSRLAAICVYHAELNKLDDIEKN